MHNTDPYSPCPCGSGKKYKFCCLQKQREREQRSSSPSFFSQASTRDMVEALPENVLVGDLDEGQRLCNKGLRLMGEGEFEKAIPLFRKSIPAAPFVYTAANNLAICLLATGKLDAAIRVQSESLTASPLPNPFGLASLAALHYVNGNEVDGRRYLDMALKAEMPSADACVKVCETLARFKRHQAILDTAAASGYDNDPGVCFFAGVAAANLGEHQRAQLDLARVPRSYYKADMARRYLQHLREKSVPHTVRGDWPYLLAYEICPCATLQTGLEHDSSAWLSRRITVDFCEAMLNASADNPGRGFDMLKLLKHPDAIELIWLIVKGTFGPDSLRMAAVQSLQERGAIKPKQDIDVFFKGERRKTTMSGIRLNPDFHFGKQLPEELGEVYGKAVMAGQKKKPNWEALGKSYLRVMQAEPEYYPARYNYAISLLHRGIKDEAEVILRELVKRYPEYLFAHATLLQILARDGRTEEADALLKATAMPEETHPDAFAAWMVAQALYHEHAGRDEEAFACIKTAHDLAPDRPSVKQLWQDYTDE